VLRGHDGVVFSVAFRPDGTTLASGSADRTIMISPFPTTRMLAEIACEKSLRNLSKAEWEQFVGPGIRYERTCPSRPSGR
jgi:WD40 repeat protein